MASCVMQTIIIQQFWYQSISIVYLAESLLYTCIFMLKLTSTVHESTLMIILWHQLPSKSLCCSPEMYVDGWRQLKELLQLLLPCLLNSWMIRAMPLLAPSLMTAKQLRMFKASWNASSSSNSNESAARKSEEGQVSKRLQSLHLYRHSLRKNPAETAPQKDEVHSILLVPLNMTLWDM